MVQPVLRKSYGIWYKGVTLWAQACGKVEITSHAKVGGNQDVR